MRAQRLPGFTLVELLVALAIAGLLATGIASIYLENKRSYYQDDELARIQENARYAIKLLKRELTMAGFMAGIPQFSGLAASAVSTGCVAAKDWALDATEPLDLIDNADSGSTLTSIKGHTWTCIPSGDVLDDTDIVAVKRTAGSYTLKDGSLPSGVSEDDEQWYLRTFDNNAQLSWVYLGNGASIPVGDKTAGSSVSYWEYYARIFFVREFSVTDGDGIPSLCMAELNASVMSANCYVEGIEDLQVEFGIDTDNDSVPNQFKTAPTSVELDEAVAVRVYLLVRSVNTVPGYTNSKTYQLGTKSVGAKNDAFIRRVFSTTVQMRNAKLPNA